MNRIKLGVLLLVAMAAAGGCAENPALIKAKASSPCTDVFEETEGRGDAVLTELRVTASLKTHKPGIYSASDPHGTGDYKLLLKIDGRSVVIHGTVINENTKPTKLKDTEAGEGTRYRFSKSLRLTPGRHRISVSFPDDGVFVEREIDLSSAQANHLVIEPVYRTSSTGRWPGARGTASFKEGLGAIRLALNNRAL